MPSPAIPSRVSVTRSDRASGARAGTSSCHQNRVAGGEVGVCVWFAGGICDHAAASIIVEESRRTIQRA